MVALGSQISWSPQRGRVNSNIVFGLMESNPISSRAMVLYRSMMLPPTPSAKGPRTLSTKSRTSAGVIDIGRM